MNKINAVILAGALADFGEDTTISRAMIQIGPKTMLSWIVDALRNCNCIGSIVAVGNVECDGLTAVIDPGKSLLENMKKGIDFFDSSTGVLILSCDIPLVTSEAIEDFLKNAVSDNIDLAVPIIDKKDCLRLYPQFKRTYIKTSDGIFTMGNIMFMSTRFVLNNWQLIEKSYNARKNVAKLASMMGIGFLFRVILAQFLPQVLKIKNIEDAAARMLSANVKAVVSVYPEIGEDIDKQSDLDEVRKLLK